MMNIKTRSGTARRCGISALVIVTIPGSVARPASAPAPAPAPAPTSKAVESDAARKLVFSLNENGLSALSYDGRALVKTPENGRLQPVNWTPKFKKADGTSYSGEAKPLSSVLDAGRGLLTQTYPWGVVKCLYSQDVLDGSRRLNIKISVSNTSRETLSALEMQLGELDFGLVPDGATLDAGMFGTGAMHPLHQYPLAPDASVMPPIIAIDYKVGALDFCVESDDAQAEFSLLAKAAAKSSPATISIPWSANQPENTRYPFRVSFANIAPKASRTATISWRFGAPGSQMAIASDLTARFRAMYPFKLKWPDRRPIAAMYLSTSEAHPAKNPRGYFTNSTDVDTTTPEGVAALRVRILKMADESVAVMKHMNAQGMVLWDPEGQEFGHVTYYGDPRLEPRTAPELEWKPTPRDMSTIDAYFQKFRDAGVRVGVCIRPQQMEFENGVPTRQSGVSDAFALLKAKIEYARKRWGCTLFYIDSTVDGRDGNSGEPINADVFDRLGRAFPDTLLMPENQNLRFYASTAPLDSFMHHHVASTPQSVRAVYPQAFTVLLASATDSELDAYHDALLAAVRRGDILMFRGWWNDPGNAKIKAIYDEAARK